MLFSQVDSYLKQKQMHWAMNRRDLFSILLVTLFMTGCSHRNKPNYQYTQSEIESLQMSSTENLHIDVQSIKEIDLNSYLGNKDFDFGNAVKSMKIIKLETTDESLIGNIYKILMTPQHIYIQDDFKGGGLIIFTANGNFVRRIRQGGGPGELYKLYDMAYDQEANRLIAYQHPFLLHYSSDGEYIEQQKLPFGFYNLTTIPNGYVFKTLDECGNEHLGNNKNNTLLVTDKQFKLKFAGLPSSHINVNYGGYCYLYKNENEIQITNKLTDTIYCYDYNKNQLKATYILDYKDKKIPSALLTKQGADFRKALAQNDYYYFIGEYLENQSHQAIFLRNNYRGTQTIVYRDKATGKLIGGNRGCFDIQEIPAVVFPKSTYKNYFISVHHPNSKDSLLENSNILSPESKQILRSLKKDDNPVLVLFQLKSF